MNAHTPGPWEIGYGGNDGDDYAVIVSPFRNRAICNLEPRDYILENARLIASAPELLEAARAVMEWAKTPGNHGGNPYFHDFVKKAEAAIAKAEGKEIS